MQAEVIKSDHNELSEDTFSADDYLLNIVKRAQCNGQDIQVNTEDNGSITILASKGIYYDCSRDIASFCRLSTAEFKVNVLNSKEVSSDKTVTSRNLNELMWIAGFYASAGRLMDGCFRDDVVELIHWPNMTRLPSTDNSMRLASLLANHPTSITLACRFLGIDKAEAYQFYSAARCAGLARAINRTAQEPRLKPHRNQALLGLLLNRIARI